LKKADDVIAVFHNQEVLGSLAEESLETELLSKAASVSKLDSCTLGYVPAVAKGQGGLIPDD
jgi:hypothetical protein